MTSGQVVTLLVALIGGTGVWETIRRGIDARSKRRAMQDNRPESVADSSVQRAQQALLVMEGSLRATERRAEVAEAEVRELRGQVDQLEADIRSIQERLQEATVQLSQALTQVSTLRQQIPPRTENG